MTDVHCHLLPIIDIDGSQRMLEDSLELFKEAYYSGLHTQIINTSHYISNGRFRTNADEREIDNCIFRSFWIIRILILKLYNGAEAYLSTDLPELFENGTIPTLTK